MGTHGPVQYHHMARVHRAIPQQPLPSEVKKNLHFVTMHTALIDAANEWDEDTPGTGVSGKRCQATRNLKEQTFVIEHVDQFKNEVALFDPSELDIFVVPTWSILQFENVDTRSVPLHECIISLFLNLQ